MSCLIKFYLKIKTDCWSLFVICLIALTFLGNDYMTTYIFTTVDSVSWLVVYMENGERTVVAESVDLVC